jgi:hypothetical protein
MGKEKGLREALLRQEGPSMDLYAQYKKEVEKMIQREEEGFRKGKWALIIGYANLVVVGVVLMLVGAFVHKFSNMGLWTGILACFVFINAVIIISAYYYHLLRLELLKESKGIQMMLAELIEKKSQRQ